MKTTIGFHEGNVLLRLAATYSTILQVISEAVQNALDKNATRVQILINKINRSITICDNGDGVSPDEFQRALESIGKTIKRDDKIGRFGLGLIASIDKCVRMLFTSTPKSNFMAYRKWSFVKNDLEGQKQFSGIPNESVPNIRFVRNAEEPGAVWWRTKVQIEKYTADRYVSRVEMDLLRDELISKYSVVMQRNDVTVFVEIIEEDGKRNALNITAPEYDGEKLPEIDLNESGSGITRFCLYLARKTFKGRIGRVQVGEIGNDFRISFKSFGHSLPEGVRLSADVLSALTSGVFEGEILTTKARFHANRKGFEPNDALLGFCTSIERWFDSTGSQHFKVAQDTRREERYQNLGVRSLRVLEAFLKEKIGAQFLRLIQEARKGTIGTGHAEVPGRLDDITAISTDKGGRKPGSKTGDDPEHRETPDKEKLGHVPTVVVGPKGERRVVVRSNSLGITLVHDNAMNSPKLWVFEADTGTLRLNTRHPLWVHCDQCSDVVLMRFQEFLMVHALWVHLIPEEWRDIVHATLDDLYPPYAWLLEHGDTIADRTTIVRKFSKAAVAQKLPVKRAARGSSQKN